MLMFLVLTTLWSLKPAAVPQKAATRGGIRSLRGGIHRQREEDVNVVHRERGMEFLLCMQRVELHTMLAMLRHCTTDYNPRQLFNILCWFSV
ncbi:hypothetical protein CEXT_810681 [Caerostris extrusa]|uniref:Secreted protein n=1 Tax=Caerostris extrusa TaxID=172846 RepID=A0AAV4QNT5_CAEEX|nr:hypothetical protein CEXT_810681 [Caerostris extrusa]